MSLLAFVPILFYSCHSTKHEVFMLHISDQLIIIYCFFRFHNLIDAIVISFFFLLVSKIRKHDMLQSKKYDMHIFSKIFECFIGLGRCYKIINYLIISVIH